MSHLSPSLSFLPVLLLALLLPASPATLAAGPGQPGGPGEAMVDTDPCPAGWRLSGQPKPNGAFACRPQSKSSALTSAAPQSAPPSAALACPPGTAYFIEQTAKHQRLGCQRLPTPPRKPAHSPSAKKGHA